MTTRVRINSSSLTRLLVNVFTVSLNLESDKMGKPNQQSQWLCLAILTLDFERSALTLVVTTFRG